MKNFLRLLKIWWTLGHYRIDLLLPKEWQSPVLRLCLLPFLIFKKPEASRGACLRNALEDLGPIFIKFGQLLSTRPDIMPPDMMEELNQLQDNVRPFDNDTFKSLVETALGAPTHELFSEFESAPLASASIAQVHGAILKDGKKVVVKAVRPNIHSVIERDVALMMVLARFVERYAQDGKRLRPVEVVIEYKQTIFDELDLQREAANAIQLRRNWEDSGKLYVPEIYWDYCRSNVLVMERIYGAQVTDIATLKKHNVNIRRLAELGVEIFFTQVFEHNFFHADMHPGNVYVALDNPDEPSYIALDMAIIGTLSRQDQYYLARNMLAMFRRDYRLVAELHVMSGWVPKDTSIGAFEAAIRTVCEPVFEKPIKDIAFGDALLKLFQTARRFDMHIQPQLVLLQKTLVNIEGLGRQLYPELDLWETAHPFMERWIKKRFNPLTVFADLRRQAPEIMERLPDIPHLLLETTQNLNEFAQAAPAIQAAATSITDNKKTEKRKKRRRIIAALAFMLAAYMAWPNLGNIPTDALVLAGIGLLALLLS